MGVLPLAAHFFCFYFSIISAVTPPVALGALAGAGIAEANYFQTAVKAFKLSIAGFIIPYLIVYNPVLTLHVENWAWAVGSLVSIPIGLITLFGGHIQRGAHKAESGGKAAGPWSAAPPCSDTAPCANSKTFPWNIPSWLLVWQASYICWSARLINSETRCRLGRQRTKEKS